MYNWWGSNKGPKASKFFGDVTYIPWLTSPPQAPVSLGPDVGNDGEPLPSVTRLVSAVPNPFNPVTTIRFDVAKPGGDVRIEVFDVAGRLIKRLVSENKPAGFHKVVWEGRDEQAQPVASGVYFVRMKTAKVLETRKLVILK